MKRPARTHVTARLAPPLAGLALAAVLTTMAPPVAHAQASRVGDPVATTQHVVDGLPGCC